MNKGKKCVICGFNKRVESHHIIKRSEFGSDEETNMVYLCLNHHWIADFGNEKDRQIILDRIIRLTGKEGKRISSKEIDLCDLKIKALEREMFGDSVDNNEWWESHKNTRNYVINKNWILGVGCNSYLSSLLNKKAEMLILVEKLRKEIDLIKC